MKAVTLSSSSERSERFRCDHCAGVGREDGKVCPVCEGAAYTSSMGIAAAWSWHHDELKEAA